MFDNKGEIDALKLVIETLKAENEHLRARIVAYEVDERETRRGMLTRLGVIFPTGENGEKKPGPQPVKKTRIPWAQQASQLEIDSRERYYKKLIEDREKPQEQRKAESEAKSGAEKTESEMIQDDIREMEK